MNLVIVLGCDWQAIYVDGKRVLQDYRLSISEVINMVVKDYGGKISTFATVYPDEKWELEQTEGNGFPLKLEDVKINS